MGWCTNFFNMELLYGNIVLKYTKQLFILQKRAIWSTTNL